MKDDKTSFVRLPDGSGVAFGSMPLPKDHWLTEDEGFEPPPMTFRLGKSDPRRKVWEGRIRRAGMYALRAATMRGTEDGLDPDALIQNLVVGLLGYHTPDGLDPNPEDAGWSNPNPIPPVAGGDDNPNP